MTEDDFWHFRDLKYWQKHGFITKNRSVEPINFIKNSSLLDIFEIRKLIFLWKSSFFIGYSTYENSLSALFFGHIFESKDRITNFPNRQVTNLTITGSRKYIRKS